MSSISSQHSESGSDALLMSSEVLHHWPPAWRWVAGTGARRLEGDSAVLQNVALSEGTGGSRCHLLVEHAASYYLGTLLFDDAASCRSVHQLLLNHLGESIRSIGALAVDQSAEPASNQKDEFSNSMDRSLGQLSCVSAHP